jgi:hypothetical protein
LFGVKFLEEVRDILLHQFSTLALGPTQTPIQGVQRVLSLETSGQGRKLTTHLHLVLRFRMSEVTSLLLLYAFTACKGTTLPSGSAPMLEGYLLFTVYKCLPGTSGFSPYQETTSTIHNLRTCHAMMIKGQPAMEHTHISTVKHPIPVSFGSSVFEQ